MAGYASSLPGPLGLEAGGHTERMFQLDDIVDGWMDGVVVLASKFSGKGLTYEIIACHSLMGLGLMVMVCLPCSHRP